MHKNPPLQQQRARELRQNSTDAERWLWQRLRNRQLLGQKFRRQVPVGQYIVDFLCRECKLVVELDGSQHQQQKDYDDRRTQFLEDQGYRVLRYWNNEVLQQGEAVLESIVQALADGCGRPLTPNPSPRWGEGLKPARRSGCVSEHSGSGATARAVGGRRMIGKCLRLTWVIDQGIPHRITHHEQVQSSPRVVVWNFQDQAGE